ncbi:MAG: neutral/alkaline non-lysosomal ceramidase N-terminal domain-containing protein [Proteiniphilum sp.]|nr:neutral/alkaline non-lysosomal ceramidase N-terminal domain-containing protein [Proteiniphilum sp.]
MSHKIKAGASVVNITPEKSHFLYGYPYVERMSTGVHDELQATALFLSDNHTEILFVSLDIIYVTKETVSRIRKAVTTKTGIPGSHILIAATHTHSAPVTAEMIISSKDPVVPRIDQNYLRFLEESTIIAACRAVEKAEKAEIGFVKGDATGVGTNRHDPAGPKDMDVPALLVRSRNNETIACMLICNMHPTILHEDSTLYSSDFPHYTRKNLRQHLGERCSVLYFTGTAGNQSPRHVTQSNTFGEAERIGKIVSDAIISRLEEHVAYSDNAPITARQALVNLPTRNFPSVVWAKRNRDDKKKLFEELRNSSATSQQIRTAEVNWFGSEELLLLSTLVESNGLESIYDTILPAEIQIVKIRDHALIAWPGEVFVEYGLELKKHFNNVSLITYANGELQGYLVTKEANEKGFYESGNALFDHTAGERMTETTMELLKELGQ